MKNKETTKRRYAEIPLAFYPMTLEVHFLDHTEYWPSYSGDASTTAKYDENKIVMNILVDNDLEDDAYNYYSENHKNVIVHEICHVKQALEKYIDTEFDDETESYFCAWLFDVIYRAYMEYCFDAKKGDEEAYKRAKSMK